MNLNLEIEQGSQADNIGKSLEQSTVNLGKDMVMTAGTGAANVIASTGINVGVGTTDEIIADNIAAAVNLTGEQGLTNLAFGLENYSQQLAAMGLNTPEQLVDILLGTINDVLGETGVINAVQKGLQITENTVDMAKIGLNVAYSTATAVANIQKLLTKLNKMQDVEVTCVPSVKDTVNAFSASFINQLKAQYEALKQQLIIFYNSMICTSNDNVLDNIIVSFNNILNVLEPIIDPIMQKYTGHSVQEIRNICNQGFAYIGMIQRDAARKRQQKENEQQEKIEEPEVPRRKLSKEEKEKLKQERREISKKKWEQKTKDLSIEQSREKLLIWFNDQSIMIQNAFLLLIIKDTIDDIKRFISQLQNTSIENQVDLLNTINNILEIFDRIGLTPDAQGITIEDLKKLGMAAAGTIVATAVDIGNQVQQNADEFTQQYINEVNAENAKNGIMPLSSNVVADARGTVAAVSNKTQQIAENNPSLGIGEVAEQTAKEVSVEVGASGLDQLIQIAINAGLSMDMDAIARGEIPTINTNSFSSSVVENDMFSYSQENSNKDIIINITINKNPSMHLLAINSFIKSFKSGNNKDIFNNGATKQIRDAFKEAWELNEVVELEISAIVDGVTKYYKFIIDVNKDARKNPEKYEVNDTSNNLDISNGLNVSSNLSEPNLSQLSKVDIHIDAALLEQILFDPSTGKYKILIFDEVVQFLKILQPVIQTLRVLAHLLENYIINKEFVREKRHVDLAYALKNAAQLINGLKDIIDLKNTNFFTIRTQEMADWAKSTFTSAEIKDGLMVIGKIDTFIDGISQLTGNNPDTLVLNEYCAAHAIKPEVPLDLLKGTILYFDKWSIENGGYKDGTTNNLDNIEINNTLGELYYDASQRSTISSEILRARKKKIDPNYIKTAEIENENKSIKELLNLTKFNSDEMEGQQTLNLCDLNLCPKPSIQEISDNNPQQSAVIIEFGDEYTLGDKVDYNIVVKPGQTIKEGDILAYITKSGVQSPLRTKFTGVHFIIDNYSPCMPVDYNIDDVMNLSKRFKMATELGAFILNCMPLSILPILLVNANRDNNTNDQSGSIITGGIQETTGVFSKFEEIMTNYDTSINAFNNEIKNLSSQENFNSSTIIQNEKEYYTIPINRNKEIYNNIMSVRSQMIETAIDTYNEALNISTNGDYTYGDCVGLAFDDNVSFKYGVKGDDDKQIDNINYYINLLQNIPESKNMEMSPINIDTASINLKLNEMYGTVDSSNAVDISNDKTIKGILNSLSQVSNNTEENEDNYINEYRDIIESIINNRLILERKNTSEIYKYFNTYYSTNILGLLNTIDAFTQLKNKLVEQEYSLNDNEAILNLIKLDKLGKSYNLKDSKDYNNFRKADSDKMQNDEKYYNQCQYALTIFVYLLHADVEKTIKPLNKILIESSGNYNGESANQYIESSAEYSNIDQKRKNNQKYFELIQKESKLILEFWKKVLAAYNDPNGKYNLDNVIKDIKGYADKMNSYVKWPTPINIKVDNTNYELYTFANRYEVPKSTPEEIIVPTDMDNVEIPDPVVDLNNLPDPRDRDKITIMDYEYWLVYMLNATIFTLIPVYWADGFDIPPFMIPTLLPAIYFPIAPPVMIPVVNVLMVFGIALRGIWPMPIILMVNLSSSDIDAMVFIKIALEIIKDIFKKSQELIENGIPMMINKLVKGYISENQAAQKAIEKFKTYSSIIHAIPIEDKALIEKKFNEALVDEMNKQTKLNAANGKLENAKNKLKNFDRRQIITRESDLGKGPEPM